MVFWIRLLLLRIRLRLSHAVTWIRSMLLFVADEYCIVQTTTIHSQVRQLCGFQFGVIIQKAVLQ